MNSAVERTAELLVSVDQRLQVAKNTGNDIIQASEGSNSHELIGPQYVSLPRLPDSLPKVQLVTDTLSSELLGSHVVELASSSDIVSSANAQYYEDELLEHDLTEDDKRLAAALVAVQLVQQQKHQNSILATELLNGKSIPPLSPFTGGSIDKPGMAAMVTSYIQSLEEDTTQHLLEPQPQDRLKVFNQNPSQLPELRLPPLPPLKKVLSTQNVVRTKNDKNVLDEHITNSSRTNIDNDLKLPLKSVKVGIDMSLEEQNVEDIDSDYEIDSDIKPSRRSLPHKKRIPRKLKTQPQRNIHSKCYKCQKCGDTFSTQSSFFSHRSQHTNPTKRILFSCEICGSQYSNQIKFFEHLKTHYEPKNETVGTTISTEINEFNENDEVGPVVLETFSLKTECQQVRKFNDSNISCEHCGRLFRRQKAYETHKAAMHPPLEEFSEPEDMMEGIRHVVNIQTDADDDSEEKLRSWRFTDELGMTSDTNIAAQGKTFTQSDSFEDNPAENVTEKGKSKKNKATQCPHCTRVFVHRNSLIYHIKSHSGMRPHQCEVCGKRFFAANALRVHMRMHSGDKPYKCEVCNRRFRQWGDLKYHMTSLHSTQKQYQCEFCGKDFARKYSLIIHRRIHTGEKNYVCEFCRKTFRASCYLVNHRRIHTGEKPYTCDVCRKPFRVKSDMKRHRNTHNKERNVTQDRISQEAIVAEPEAETILPDTGTPLNLNMRNESAETLAYSRDALERDPNTLYVWLPAAGDSILSDE